MPENESIFANKVVKAVFEGKHLLVGINANDGILSALCERADEEGTPVMVMDMEFYDATGSNPVSGFKGLIVINNADLGAPRAQDEATSIFNEHKGPKVCLATYNSHDDAERFIALSERFGCDCIIDIFSDVRNRMHKGPDKDSNTKASIKP